MRPSNPEHSGFYSFWLCEITRRTSLFSLAAICASSVVMANGPSALQLDFVAPANSPKLPMEIVNGAEPASADNIQPATRDSESVVQIPDETKGTTLEVFTGTNASQTVADVQPQVISQKEVSPLSNRDVMRLDQLTARLVSRSREAWLRGLMDQATYDAWLDLASTTQLRVARQQGDEKRVLQVLRSQVALWTEATVRLEEFNQPASYGWEADLAHSQVMMFRAKMRYQAATGRTLTSADHQAYQLLATRHLDARLAEFQTGIGTAASVLAAARMVDEQLTVPEIPVGNSGQMSNIALATFQVEQPVAIRSALKEILRPVHLAIYPKAISTRDLAEDRMAIRLAETYAAYINTPENDRVPERFLGQLGQCANEIADRQFARFPVGTSTVGDMLRTWWLQESIAGSLAEQLRENTDFYASQTQRLEGIHQFAMSISDLRGRNSADVAAADLLLTARRLDLEPLSGRKKAEADGEVPQNPEALVIEYDGTPQATGSAIIINPQ